MKISEVMYVESVNAYMTQKRGTGTMQVAKTARH